MFTKNNLKTNAVADEVAKILEAEEMKDSYGDTKPEDGPARKTIKAHPINPKEYKDQLDKKYAKPGPYVGDVKEATEKPTHIISKELLSDHKRWMDSEGFDTHTVPLPKSHPKHATHVGIVAKNNNEAGYHEDGFARPIHESAESIDEVLKGGQKKIDKNHNGKLDAQDFKMLRGEKPVEEAALGVPLKGHPYHKKTDAELRYIQKDAAEAAKAMKFHAPRSEAKYLDQVNDASTVLHYRSKGGKQLAKEEVEIDEADNLTMRGLHTANPQSIPSYMRSTEKGKKSLADKNRPILKQIIKGQLGKHPKPNLPEEVEELDELSKDTLMSYVKKGEKQQGKNFDDILSAHKGNDQPKANKANAKYLKRNAGLDRAVDKMYSKYDKKTEEVESIDELSKSTVRSYANKKSAQLSDVPPMPFKKKPMSDRENRNADKGMMGALRRLNKEEVDLDESSTATMGHAGKTTLKHIKNPGVQLRMAAHDVKPGIKGYRDRVDLMRAADAEGKLKKEETEELDEKKGDTDLGTFTDNNMGEMTDAQMKKRETIVRGMKKGLAGFKERYGKRAKDVMYATATKQAMKDEAVDPKVKTTDTLAGRIKGGDENQHTSYKVKLKTEAMGCENTPMSRATNLAKAAYKKLKNETMMGKAGGTSEEKE